MVHLHYIKFVTKHYTVFFKPTKKRFTITLLKRGQASVLNTTYSTKTFVTTTAAACSVVTPLAVSRHLVDQYVIKGLFNKRSPISGASPVVWGSPMSPIEWKFLPVLTTLGSQKCLVYTRLFKLPWLTTTNPGINFHKHALTAFKSWILT